MLVSTCYVDLFPHRFLNVLHNYRLSGRLRGKRCEERKVSFSALMLAETVPWARTAISHSNSDGPIECTLFI